MSAAATPRDVAASARGRAVAAMVQLLAAGLWLGGLVVLGAVVAPTIFRNVPAPTSADAMTLVFRRFDKVAMICGAVLLLVEAWRAFARLDGARVRADLARVGVAGVAAALAVGQGMVISPRIAELHASGAVRGLDAAGRQLDSIHKLAEAEAKVQLALLVVFVALVVHRLARPRP